MSSGHFRTISVLFALALGTCSLADTTESVQPKNCRVIPSDAEWPSEKAWSELNETVHGRLVATIPIGAPCYRNTYNVVTKQYDLDTFDEAACAKVRTAWLDPALHEQSSSSAMATYFAKDACNPFAATDNSRCGIGGYVQYAIDIFDDEDVRAGLAFAKKHNIRLVVRNTGHEYVSLACRRSLLTVSSFLGKSTGFGALAVWTHHLDKIGPVTDRYRSANYNGPALKVQAGVQVSAVYDFLEPHGYVALGGECATVGLAGGYIFGGGHSLLSSKLGLAADQILEIEGILANGTSFLATPERNKDIYWFLSGSGSGGTIAYIKDVTFKIHKDFPVSALTLAFAYEGILSDSDYWTVIDTWHALTPRITDAGGYALAVYPKGAPFVITPVFVPGATKEEVVQLIQPLLDKLGQLKIDNPRLAYNLSTFSFPNYNIAYKKIFPFIGSGPQYASRLIPRSIITDRPAALSETIKTLFDDHASVAEAVINPNLGVAKPVDNSVLPAWRTSIFNLYLGKAYNDSASLQENTANRKHITQHWTSALERLAPASQGGGVYLNEADSDDPNWQANFYGRNYPRQLAIKKLYDPDGFWYAKTAVGSEFWAEQTDGRLCRS